MKSVSVYVIQRISDGAYLYVGSSIEPKKRFGAHRRANPYPLIREAFDNNDVRFLVITDTDEDHRIEVEANLWRAFKAAGHPIENDEPRPYGGSYAGKHHSDHAKRKMSIAKKGKPMTPRGDEYRHNLSAALKGHPPTRTGPMSEEAKRKISEAKKGVPHPHKGYPCSEETKQKIRDTKKRNQNVTKPE